MATRGRKHLKKSPVEGVDKIYFCNLNYVPPKDQNLETIYEEPRESKDGKKVLTSKIKYKRYLSFDPTINKIQKRKRKTKKCVKRMKTSYRVTRSCPETSNQDVSLCFDALDGSSNSSDAMDCTSINQSFGTQSDVCLNMCDQDSTSKSVETFKEIGTIQGSSASQIFDLIINNESCKGQEEDVTAESLKIPCALS